MDRIASAWNDLAGRVRVLWNGQSAQNRMLAAGLLGALALAFAALFAVYVGHKPSYEVLFSNLSATDAASVTQHLKDDKVPYQLSSDGKTVYVPSQNLSDERVAIAGSNVIKGGSTGYELFDRTNFGMTEFEQNIDKTRAVEGELERTIGGLDPVEAARVHIAVPDQTLYSNDQTDASASIALTVKPGMQLSPEQVQGITMLVSHAVQGLKPEGVTIIDQNGQVLIPAAGSGAASADPLNLTQEQLLAKQRYENALQASIQSMLDQTLGPRRAVARVSTKMNFDANTTETKTYAPQGTVLSTQSKRESYTGTGPRPAAIGVPGTTSNIPTYQAQQSGGNSRYNKAETTTNYNVSEQNVKHIDAPGKVTQTSVAVVLNSTAVASAAVRRQVQNLVVAAADLNLNNGDQVSVEAIPFTAGTAGAPAAGGTGAVFGVPLWALLAALGGAALLGFGLLLGRMRRGFRPALELPSFDSTLAEELPPFEEHPMLDGAPGIAAPIRSAADLTREQMIEYVTTVAQENPDSIAKLVKLWLSE